jgi:hypothetical protein
MMITINSMASTFTCPFLLDVEDGIVMEFAKPVYNCLPVSSLVY